MVSLVVVVVSLSVLRSSVEEGVSSAEDEARVEVAHRIKQKHVLTSRIPSPDSEVR